MGDWYWIGVLAGLGAALGVLFVGVLGWARAGVAAALLAAAGAGIGAGLAIAEWDEALAGAAGGLLGGAGTVPVLRGTLRRGGTRAGTAAILGVAAVVIAALTLVPAAGYLLALAVPALGVRLRRGTPERYAGLRTLAR